jgi:hypothetical protein
LFDREIVMLECPPFKFYYRCKCDHQKCWGHKMSIVDWEVIQNHRRWQRDYGDQWGPSSVKSMKTERQDGIFIYTLEQY